MNSRACSLTGRINWGSLSPGAHRISCPACGRSECDKTAGLTIRPDGSGVAHCFRCDYVETNHGRVGSDYGFDFRTTSKAMLKLPKILLYNQNVPVLDLKRFRSPVQYERLSDSAQHIWEQSQELHGVALQYLKARRCVIPPAEGDLRFHRNLKHPSGYAGPALVARITDVLTNEAISLHRTWIRADGSKANVDAPRLLLGRHRKQGGVIRLWPDESVTYGLGVAEGIETSLSLAWGYTPVWSLIDAGNVSALPVLPGIETLIIGADNDLAGQGAADVCGARWAKAGVDVRITQQTNNDLNDLVMEAYEC